MGAGGASRCKWVRGGTGEGAREARSRWEQAGRVASPPGHPWFQCEGMERTVASCLIELKASIAHAPKPMLCPVDFTLLCTCSNCANDCAVSFVIEVMLSITQPMQPPCCSIDVALAPMEPARFVSRTTMYCTQAGVIFPACFLVACSLLACTDGYSDLHPTSSQPYQRVPFQGVCFPHTCAEGCSRCKPINRHTLHPRLCSWLGHISIHSCSVSD